MKFPKTTEKEDVIASIEGTEIFAELRKKYSNQNVQDLDIVLNSLCYALVRLGYVSVGKNDYKMFVDLIHYIILTNLEKMK